MMTPSIADFKIEKSKKRANYYEISAMDNSLKFSMQDKDLHRFACQAFASLEVFLNRNNLKFKRSKRKGGFISCSETEAFK